MILRRAARLFNEKGYFRRIAERSDAFRRNATDPTLAGGCIVMNTAIESDDAHSALRERARKAIP